MDIEKFISYQIEKQFPSLFREDGKELVELVKYYYRFLEENTKQSVYHNRRLFEYRDIDNTLENMVIYFKNKYMKDLPLDSVNSRFIIKNILDLYRRRGTTEGIELFFKLFYDETISVYYPSDAILKPSFSSWNGGAFLQLYPVDINELRNLTGRSISGSASKAEAVVDRVLFILVNNILTPILYINDVKGTFMGFDDIYARVDGQITNFGRVYGSLSAVTIDENDERATTGNQIGDMFNVSQLGARGGKAIVTDVSQNITGEITYVINESGFGYTTENTLLHVSNQVIFVDNLFSELVPLEPVEDQFGNRGIIIGGNDIIVGIKMDEVSEFTANSEITTLRSENNITIVDQSKAPYSSPNTVYYFTSVVEKNSSSPGSLYPETANTESVKLDEMDNIETVSLITDVISNFLNVPLNSLNFNDPPALIPMSGSTDPVDIDTQLDVAFNLEPFEIGSIKKFINVRPGLNYMNRVFALAYDPVMYNFDVYNQIISLQNISSTFAVGGIISQGSKKGKILNISGNTILVLPYSYYGFDKAPITYSGKEFSVVSVSRDYSSNRFGLNSNIHAITSFATGKVLSVNITNSGYGYIDGAEVFLTDANDRIVAVGVASARGQGKIEGRWSSQESHLNFQDGKVLQDSDFYQEYSYQISSKTDINIYKDTLTDTVHLAGTKMFGKFLLKDAVDVSSNIKISIIRNS